MLSEQDKHFLQQFEQLSLPPEQFNHLGHLKIAWIYLVLNQDAKDSASKACEQVCNGIKAYAESLGAAMKFHLTITKALVFIMAQRMNALKQQLNKSTLNGDDWQIFIEQNTDLVNDAIGVLRGFYSKELLDLDDAKIHWYEPDVMGFCCGARD